jgi:plastocyanin
MGFLGGLGKLEGSTMRFRRIACGTVAIAGLFGSLSACSSKDPVALTVKASGHGGTYAFDMPKQIDGGTVKLTLANTDSQPHELGLVRVKGGTSSQQVANQLLDSGDGAPIPDFVLDAGGVGFAAPGKKVTATQKLVPGTYVYFCTFGDGDAAHYKHGMLGTVTIKGTKGEGGLGSSDESITAKETTKDKYGFDVTSLKAGTHKLLFKNAGPNQVHHAQLFPIAKGKTFADVQAFFASNSSGDAPPPVDFDKGLGTTVLGPGQSQVVDLTLSKGNYVVLCFLNDRAGGPPHFTKGMLQPVTVK